MVYHMIVIRALIRIQCPWEVYQTIVDWVAGRSVSKARDSFGAVLVLKPQSHRIVRFIDRTIGCDLANVRPIGNVCYDLQKR